MIGATLFFIKPNYPINRHSPEGGNLGVDGKKTVNHGGINKHDCCHSVVLLTDVAQRQQTRYRLKNALRLLKRDSELVRGKSMQLLEN